MKAISLLGELKVEIELLEKCKIREDERLNREQAVKDKLAAIESREKGLVQRELACNGFRKEISIARASLQASIEREKALEIKLEAQRKDLTKKLEEANKRSAELAGKIRETTTESVKA